MKRMKLDEEDSNRDYEESYDQMQDLSPKFKAEP